MSGEAKAGGGHESARELLFLAHRIPYPPDKGDKIRAWHLLEHLSRRHKVHLGAFIDDPEDWKHVAKLEAVCASTCFVALDPARAKLKSLAGFLTGDPLTLPYYRSPELQDWVDARLAAGVGRILAYSSVMARFVLQAGDARRVMDFVDIDSDKWRQYAAKKPWPLSWVYAREGKRLLQWERRVAAAFDASLFVSETEAADFRRMAPESATRVGHYCNGVDADYFSPERDYPNPYPEDVVAIAFTGAMDYWPNVDAVTWFAREILPTLRRARPELQFAIVGARPAAAVRELENLPGVRVSGRVEDVRPWLAHAGAVVAPLRVARGIQNKVLEGMAMARPLVATPEALEGIAARPGEEVLPAADAAELARQTLIALERPEIGPAARRRVLRDFAWDAALARVDQLLE